MDRLRVIVEEKLNVVDKTEHEAGEFVMEVGLVFLDELGAREGADNFLQCLSRLSLSLVIAIWRDAMAGISRVGRNAVRAGGARWELFHIDTTT